jgi:hypothetical protein
MKDGGLQGPKRPPHAKVAAHIMTVSFVQSHNWHILVAKPVTEIGRVSQTHDRMPIAIRRHVVDQIDQSILQPADS